jgi:hypothetical protein
LQLRKNLLDDKEYEADIWATYILFRLSELTDASDPLASLWTEAALSAPILFLGVAMLIESSHRLKGTQIDRHPPAYDRMTVSDQVFEIFGKGFTSPYRKFIGSYIMRVHSILYGSKETIGCIMSMEICESIETFAKKLLEEN